MALKSKNPLLTFGLIPMASILAGFVLALLVSILYVQSTISSDHRAEMINLAADNAQVRVNQAQLKLLKQASIMATSIRLTELVVNADLSARALEESRLRELIPNAVKVRMIRLGEAKVDRDAEPPFTYTSLDLVNKAEQGDTVYPEAINANGRWVVGIAAPIKRPSSDTVRGTLFIYLDTAALIDEINEGLNGGVAIVQSFGPNQESEFLNVGDNSGESIDRGLVNEFWKMRFWPAKNLTEASVGSIVAYLIPPTLFLIVAAIGGFIGLNRIFAAVNLDAALFLGQIANVADGTYASSNNYRISEFKGLDAQLARVAKKPKIEATKASIKPSSEDKPKPKAKPKAKPKLEPVEEPEAEITLAEDLPFEIEEEDTDAPELEMLPTELDEADDPGPDVSGIFRAYDIRGVVGQTLNAEIAYRIGQTIGTEAINQGEDKIVVAADGRLSSPEIVSALIDGLVATGQDVINIGFVPTPLLYFATHNSEATSGVMVTGSHNPKDHNGMKIVIGGHALAGQEIDALYDLYMSGNFATGQGDATEIDIRDDYVDAITDDIVVAQPLKVVVDCGNGIAGELTPDLIGSLGCEVIELYCDVDGHFPNHHPDPTVPENLADLILTVKAEEADLGIALDGDGDRMVAVTSSGEIIWPDRLLMLFVKDVVSRNPGADVVYDVKCSRHLNSVISGFGGRPVVSRSGHSFVKAKMHETDAILGGEMSGHICFQERWFGFDDGLYASARLLEIVGSQSAALPELLAEFPTSVATPEITIPVAESHKFSLMQSIVDTVEFYDATITDIDGLRVDFPNGWGLVRASNTTACLTLRFEADDEAGLGEIQDIFREQLASVDAGLKF